MSGAFPNPGDRIGRFRVVAQLGAGGMGVVYSAMEETLDRLVALKVISPMFADDPGFRERFGREARALASLDSPNVVGVYAHGEDDGYLYIATQLIPDGDLGQMIAKWGAAPVGKAMELIEQVASGLADAHAAGLVHRDIKPANVLVRRRGAAVAAYLGDFGIARRVDAEATRVGSAMIGTPSYMAPELHRGATASTSSDLYSLGCLLWVTLTGSAPYPGTNEFEIASGHLDKPVPQLAGTSPLIDAANRILRLAMAKDPRDRYPSSASMRDELRAAARLTDDPAFMTMGMPWGADVTTPRSTPLPASPLVSPPAHTPTPTPTPTPTSRPTPAPSYGPPMPIPDQSPAPGRPRRRTGFWVAAGVAAVLAVAVGIGAGLAAGGGGGGRSGESSTSQPVDRAFAEKDPAEILSTAQREMRSLDSVHLEGNVVQDDMDLDFSMTVTSSGDCDGYIGLGAGKADLRSVDGKTWFKPDRAFWEAVSDGQEAAVDLLVSFQGGKWVDVNEDDAQDFGELCDLDTLLEGDGNDASAQTDGSDEIDGQEVVKVTTVDSEDPTTAYVGLADPHYVLRLDGGDNGAFDFSAFGEQTDFVAPPDDQTVDLDNLG